MVLRRFGSEKPYEQLKELTRGKKLSITELRQFIAKLNLPKSEKERLLSLTPLNYLGISANLASKEALDKIIP